jgi:hypothetical protein
MLRIFGLILLTGVWLCAAAAHSSSTLDFRLRTIISRGLFLVPMVFLVFIRNDCRFARLRLFLRHQLRGFARLVVRPALILGWSAPKDPDHESGFP